MPNYLHRCETCSYELEEFRYITDPIPQECSICGSGPPLFHQVYHGANFMGFVRGEPTTFGQQAELNAKRLGKEQLQLKAEAARAEMRGEYRGAVPEGAVVERPTEDLPWYRSGEVAGLPKMEAPLKLEKIKNPTDYIMTGEK